MRHSNWILAILLLGGPLQLKALSQENRSTDYPIQAVPATAVRMQGGFWGNRQEVNRTVTIRHDFKQSEETGRIKNFEIAGGLAQGQFCSRYAFDDSDVYKVMEAAAISLSLHPDPELDKYMDGLISKVAAAQEPDGYLYTARTISPKNPMTMSGPERWSKLEDSHELYNVGHLYEAAAAHFQATGKKSLLDVALKSAELILKTFGPAPNQLKKVPGHEEIEIGLVKLFRVTKDRRYLDLARFFIDQRGNAAGHKLYGEYAQDHKPFLEQTEAIGHSVRAAYLYSGAADVSALTGDMRYLNTLDRLWNDVVYHKLYLTGGIGAVGKWEGFGPAYELPNATGYAETCATIAFALWNWRMFLAHGDAHYMDLFERAAYNAFLSGVGMSGDRFFYPNVPASDGRHERTAWFACACCPPNVARFIAQLGGFAYATAGEKAYVNFYAGGKATLDTKAGRLMLTQETDYPWSGQVRLRVDSGVKSPVALMLRIPGWAVGQPLPGNLYRYSEASAPKPSVKLNGRLVEFKPERGYLPVLRAWQPGDVVELSLPMPIRRVLAHENLKEDAGRVAVERGPLVYCAEWPDNGGYAGNLVLDDKTELTARPRPDLLQGITVITGKAMAYRKKDGQTLAGLQDLTLIPYYSWAHRGKGEMAVWLARSPEQARIVPEAAPAPK